MKNANPSAENGRPKMPPEKAMKRGQRRPSSKESTVPETAPTANRMPNALDQRLASTIHASSWRHRASPSATDMRSGIPTPSTAKTMWNPSEVPIVARASVALSISNPPIKSKAQSRCAETEPPLEAHGLGDHVAALLLPP